MKYPIDTEKYIEAMQTELGPSMVRRITQWRNAAYQEGHRDVEGARA